MNLENWKPYYKINPTNGERAETNLLYTPLVNPENNILCMNFDHTHRYQNEDIKQWFPVRSDYTAESVRMFFERELKYLTVFSNRKWAPRIIDVDTAAQQIFIHWPGETLNTVIYEGGNLDNYCPTWQIQMESIITDIVKSGYYKATLYPHCYYVEDGVLRTIDFYACIEQNDPYIDFNTVKGMIGNWSKHRFEEATQEEYLNMEIMFKKALTTYVKWPGDPLPEIYKKLFND